MGNANGRGGAAVEEQNVEEQKGNADLRLQPQETVITMQTTASRCASHPSAAAATTPVNTVMLLAARRRMADSPVAGKSLLARSWTPRRWWTTTHESERVLARHCRDDTRKYGDVARSEAEDRRNTGRREVPDDAVMDTGEVVDYDP